MYVLYTVACVHLALRQVNFDTTYTANELSDKKERKKLEGGESALRVQRSATPPNTFRGEYTTSTHAFE